MYDLHQHIYVDALVQKSRKTDESAALTAMVDRSAIESALLLAAMNPITILLTFRRRAGIS